MHSALVNIIISISQGVGWGPLLFQTANQGLRQLFLSVSCDLLTWSGTPDSVLHLYCSGRNAGMEVAAHKAHQGSEI